MKIFITRIIPAIAIEKLEAAGCQVDSYHGQQELPQEELIHILQGYDALLSAGTHRLDEDFFRRCPHLKAVALLSVGYDRLDLNAAKAQGIPVSNTPGVLSRATADAAFLLMLAVSRNAFQMYRRIVNGDWGFYQPTAHLGQELYGKTLGVFGMGRIGSEMARLCKAAFSMKIVYHNRRVLPNGENPAGARYVDFDELLQASDVLSVHASLSAETAGKFDEAAFRRMKPGSIFINTARGKLHNEEALIKALREQWIWGAGLDVTNPEPMAKDNPLLTMDNVCVLPHIGSATVETRNQMALMAADNLLAVKEGRPMPQQIPG